METIYICADALCSLEYLLAPFPWQIFVELMEMVTFFVDFSFHDIMHCLIDGVAIGLLLRPALANNFVGYHESKLFQNISKPEMYYRYMDDTFPVFSNKNECNVFLHSFNLLHPFFFPFSFEKRFNLAFLFLYVFLKNPLPSSSPPFTGSPHSLVNIYAGISPVYKNAKLA